MLWKISGNKTNYESLICKRTMEAWEILQETQQQTASQVSSTSLPDKDNHDDDNDNNNHGCRKPRRSKRSQPSLFPQSKVPSNKLATKSSSSISNEDNNRNKADLVVLPSLELSMDDTDMGTFCPAAASNDGNTATRKQPIFFSNTAARLISEVPSHALGAEQVNINNQEPNQNVAAIPIATPMAPSKTPGRCLSGWKLLAAVTAVLLVVVAIVVGVAVGVSKKSKLSTQTKPFDVSEHRPSLRPSLSPSILRTIAPSSTITVSPIATLAPFTVVKNTYAPSLLTLEPLPQPNSDPTNGNKPTLLSSGEPSTKRSSPSLPPTLLPSFLVTNAPSVPSLVQVSTLQPTLVAATGPPD